MGRQFFLLCAGTLALLSSAQNSDSTQYLFGNDIRVSGAGGLIMQTGSIGLEDGTVNSMGGGGGVLFDRQLLLGIYGMGLATEIRRTIAVSDTSGQLARLDLGHGGFWLQYSLLPHKAIHPFVSMQLGWGTATWNFQRDEYFNDNNMEKVPENINDRIFVFSPSAGAEFNIASWFRPTVYVGFRFVDGLALQQTRSGDLDGIFFGINLLFGGFVPE